LEAPTPWALTVASGEAWYGSGDDPRVRFEALTARRPASVAVLPLRSGSLVLGALVLSFDDDQRFDDDRVVALTALADLLSAALTRVRLLAEEERARAAVAAAAERNAFLAEATALISAPLDERSVLERLARLCVPHLGDWCSILRPGGDGLERVIVYHRDPELAPVVDKMVGTSLALTGDNPVVVAYRTGRSRLVADVVGPMAADPTVDRSHLAHLQRLGSGNGIVVPIGPPSHPVAALPWPWPPPGPWTTPTSRWPP
jgi:hypothetical protein